MVVRHPDQFFIDGAWVVPSSNATIEVIDSGTEELFLRVAEAQQADLERAIDAARRAFDEGPWPRMTHAHRAMFLTAMATELRRRTGDIAEIWPRESGVLQSIARSVVAEDAQVFDRYAALATSFPFEEPHTPAAGGWARLVREPVGVVGAIIPWNGPLSLTVAKVAPALLAGCTVVVKAAPEAPGEVYVLAEIAEAVGLPSGVLNVLTADRTVSEALVRDRRVDKIAFTGSTVVGRRIASLLGERIGRCTLELGGKSAAIVLEDADIREAAAHLAAAECLQTGQVCASLTRVIVPRSKHDEMVEALAANFANVRVGSPFDPESQMGPLATARQRERVLSMIDKGVAEGAQLVTGGGRPAHLERGFFVEPTVFAEVRSEYAIAQEEIFGPVLSVIPVEDEAEAVRVAEDTIYGLNASVFTPDVERAYSIARRLRTGTVGINAFRSDFTIAFGGFKQSGLGREGGIEGLHPYLEVKTILGEAAPPSLA